MSLAETASAQTARIRVDLIIAKARATIMADPEAARADAQAAQRESSAIVDPTTRNTLRATALWLEGDAASRLKDFAGARPKLDEALELVARHAPKSVLEGDLLIASGSVHSETGEVVIALREFQHAHTIFLRLKDTRKQAIALICLGSMYSDAGDYPTALKYFDQALASANGDPSLGISIQNNRAAVLRDSGRYDEAERGFAAALTLAGAMHSKVLSMQILRNTARLQLLKGDLAHADATIARGIALSKGADEFSRQAMLAVAARVALQRGDPQTAAAMIEPSFKGVNLTTTPLNFHDAHVTAYGVYHALGQFEKAFAHLLAVKRLDDQITKVATSNSAALMGARFDFANQELRIARLKADDLARRVAAERQRARTQRGVFYGGAGATAIVIATLLYGLVVARRSRDQVRAANDDLALANVALGKALAAKTEFLATTSHEIRTPLNGIMGMTQVMLADETLPEATRERLAVVQAAGTTMVSLVDDILDVAKMENGKLVLESVPFDLRATIADATRLWDIQASAKAVSFRRELDACPTLVSGDPARVRQVVFNLLSNALKFTDSGEIAISATVQGDRRVAIAVRDSGIGIPADKLEAIFESFRQADAGTTRRFGGTGLGLAICRQLARAMGGEISVESRVREGSTFTVTLPLATPEQQASPVSVTPDTPALLIVEANPIARSLLRTLLAPHAERILFATDFTQALAILEAERVSRVLADGVTLAGAGDAPAASAALVGATGQGMVHVLWPAADERGKAALLEAGVHRVIEKPVSGPMLVATLFRGENDPLVSQAA